MSARAVAGAVRGPWYPTASVQLDFSIYAYSQSSVVFSFAIGGGAGQMARTQLSEDAWISPYDGIMRMAEDPNIPMQGGSA